MSIINKQQFKETFPTLESFTNMLDKTTNDYIQQDEVIQSEYLSYCNHCAGKPLSFNVWVHTDTSDVYSNKELDNLPF